MDIRITSSVTQADISRYVKEAAADAENIEVQETVQDGEAVQAEIQNEKAQVVHYDELKAALANAKIPVTEDNIKLAEVIVKSGMEVQKENVEALKEVKKQVEYVINHISEKSVQTALENGMDLEKITLNVIENIVRDTNNSLDKNETVKKEVVKEEVKSKVDKFVEENMSEQEITPEQYELISKCVEELMIQELPVTEKNVKAVLSAIQKAEGIEITDEKMAVSLIQKGKEATVENIYLAQHSYDKKSNNAKKQISEKDWKELLPHIEKIVEKTDLEDKEEAIKAARLLIENDLPVTVENIEKIVDIKGFEIENIDKEKIVQEAVSNIKKDKPVADIEISKLLERETVKISDIEITDKNIDRKVERDTETKQINQKNDKETVKEEKISVKNNETENKTKKVSEQDKKEQNKILDNENEIKFVQREISDNKKEVSEDKEEQTVENRKVENKESLRISEVEVQKIKEKNIKVSKSIQKYDEETIKKALENTDGELTIKDLQVAFEQINGNQINTKNEDVKISEEIEITTEEIERLSTKEIEKQLKVVTAKRQLAEIQLRMTSEVSAMLAKKGIDVDTVPLKELVKELKNVEDELYKSKLSQAGAKPTAENVEQMRELYDNLANIKDLSFATYKEVIHKEIPFTINAMSESEKQNRLENLLEQELLKRQQQAAQSYENSQTQPNAKFGDSFAKVASQIEHLLDGIEVEATPENVRAAKILVKNKMEVNEENIQDIKIVDSKVTKVTRELHPIIAANMIKDGLKPADMKVDEVITYMNKFKELLGEDLTDKIASYIYEMDEAKELTQNQRDTMIGIYRMLYSIEKTNGRATGFVVKNEQELTLKNLMEASQYYDRTSAKYSDIDVRIDDNFGELEKLVVDSNSIRSQLNRAYEQSEQILRERTEISTARESQTIEPEVKISEKIVEPQVEQSIKPEIENIVKNNYSEIEIEKVIIDTEKVERKENQNAEQPRETEKVEKEQPRERVERKESQNAEQPREIEKVEKEQPREVVERKENQSVEQPRETERVEREQPRETERVEREQPREAVERKENQSVEQPREIEKVEKEQPRERVEINENHNTEQSSETKLRYEQTVKENSELLQLNLEEKSDVKAMLKEIDFNTVKEIVKKVENIEKLSLQDIYTQVENLKIENSVKTEDIQLSKKTFNSIEVSENADLEKAITDMNIKEFSDILEKSFDLTQEQKDKIIDVYTAVKQPEENAETSSELFKFIIKAEPKVVEKIVQRQPNFEKLTMKQFVQDFEKTAVDEPVKLNIPRFFGNIRNNIKPIQIENINKSNELNQIFENIKQSSLQKIENFIFDKDTLDLTVAEFIKTTESFTEELDELNVIKDFGLNSLKNHRIDFENKVNSVKKSSTEKDVESQNEISDLYFENTPYEYEQTVFEKFVESSEPQVMAEIIKNYPDIENMPIETLVKVMETVQNDLNIKESSLENQNKTDEKVKEKTEEFLKQLEGISKAEPQTLLWLKNNDIPLTVKNVEIMKNLLEEPFYFGNQLKEFSQQAEKNLGKGKGIEKATEKKGFEKLKKGVSVSKILDDIEYEVSRIKKEAVSLPEYQRQNLWKQSSNIEKTLELQKAVQKDEMVYQIPMELHNGLTNMNLYVMNDKEGNGRIDEKNMSIFISMETETLGNVQVYMKMSDKNLSFQINTDKPEATKYLQAHKQQLQTTIEQLGYMVGKLNYGEEERKNPIQSQIMPQQIKHVVGKNISTDGFETIV